MIYVDSNVILDVLADDAEWFEWSFRRLNEGREEGLVTGWIVAAEVSHYMASALQLASSLEGLSVEIVDADHEAAWLSGMAFREYRRRGGQRRSLLPDFLIGGHAQAMGASVLTRDPRRFRSYFSELTLITPETENG